MKYKALFLDVDGTIMLNGRHAIPNDRIVRAIQKASKKLHVCLATGRIFPHAKPIIDHLKLSGLCIINDGTQIYDPQTKRIVHEVIMSRDAVRRSYEILCRHHVNIFINDGIGESKYYGGQLSDKTFALFVPGLTKDQADGIVTELGNVTDIASLKGLDWDKEREYIVICDAKATKLTGIVEVARRLNVNKEEIIGVGDGYNDFPLLMACGLKVAMGNAVSELKEIADYIAPSVEEDGVADVIEKYIISSR